MTSKIKNIYFGQAIGDAFGLATEFMSKSEIAQNYPNGIDNYNDIVKDEHRSRFEIGAWTDDTDQFLCIDKSIKKYGFLNSLDIAQEFKNWFNENPMGIGKTTYEILKLPEYISKPEQCAEFIWRMKGSDLAPNGALMRNAAVVIHSYENEKKVLENCKKVCQLTHFDPRCVDSCQIHGLLLSRVINGGDTSIKSILESISTLDSRTVEYIKNFGKKYNKAKMLEGVKRCINLYHSRDLSVIQMNTDNKFGCIKEEIRPIKLNMVAAGEHAGNIERYNRTVKECTRCHIHRCPYERYPRVMVTGCVVKAVKDLNQLPSQSGISQELSPSTLITGDVCPDFKRINALNFGDYVQVHRDITPTNTPRARTVGGGSTTPIRKRTGGLDIHVFIHGKENTRSYLGCAADR